MEIVQSIPKYDKSRASVVTIGTFDGVHVGHRKILDRVIRDGQKNGLYATVLTFFPHPRMVLQQDGGLKLLNTLDEKIAILEETGLDCLVIHPFTKKFSRLSAEEFVVNNLVNALAAKKVVIGYDHRFGRNRNADIRDLREFGKEFGFEVEEIPAQEIDAVSVSSTKIRKALEEGDIPTANLYLGYPYMLTGKIKKGKGLGRTLNFPTANLKIAEDYKLIPKNGAYVVKSSLAGKTYFGMMNIGVNPTVDGKNKSIEIHFFDFADDLYGKVIRVDVLHRLRDEQKFDSLEALQQQLDRDKAIAQDYLRTL